MNDDNKFGSKYSEDVLARSVTSGPKNNYTPSDFKGYDNFTYIFHEILAGETRLTKSGVSFLKESYGVDKIIDILLSKGGADFEKMGKDRIMKWLNARFDV